jgi:hypothetical protein
LSYIVSVCARILCLSSLNVFLVLVFIFFASYSFVLSEYSLVFSVCSISTLAGSMCGSNSISSYFISGMTSGTIGLGLLGGSPPLG